MSVQRRNEAESGPAHHTARLLGALFSQIVPSTPELVKAFGQRVSEIMKTPGANPAANPADGPFQSYAGIDATSIWASATSGPASISILLLACMLARKIDDAKVSVALWVQLVAIRQAETRKAAEANGHFSDASSIAAHHRISREELAAFDSSVRAWLAVADQVMVKSHKQLDLILGNLTMPHEIKTGEDPWSRVISIWISALTGFEKLLNGHPQTTKKVDFKDKLFSQQAVITVGLLSKGNDDKVPGFRWSLTLSHLKYYGDPVHSELQDNNRVTIHELQLLTLGALFSRWKVSVASTLDAAHWICELASQVRDARTIDFRDSSGIPAWLEALAQAATAYISAGEFDREVYDNLLTTGRRRSQRLLPPLVERAECPFFGLANPHLLRALTQKPGLESTIEYVRAMGNAIKPRSRNLFVAYSKHTGLGPVQVMATIIPQQRSGLKRSRQGDTKLIGIHARWISLINFPDFSLGSADSPVRWREMFRDLGIPDSEEVHILKKSSTIHLSKPLGYCDGSLSWLNPPGWLTYPRQGELCPGCSPEQLSRCSCRDEDDRLGDKYVAQESFLPICGSEEELGFCICMQESEIFAIGEESQDTAETVQQISKTLGQEAGRKLDVALALAALRSVEFNQDNFLNYIKHIASASYDGAITAPLKLGHYGMSKSVKDSLEALAVCEGLLAQCPGSTFPMKLANQPLCKGNWFPEMIGREASILDVNEFLFSMSRTRAFACICMLESGGINVSESYFDHAFALSASNAIYVAEAVLTDPAILLPTYSIRKIVGNLGIPGISVILSPEILKLADSPENFRAIHHQQYNYRRENSFAGVTLHLSLTDWRVPVPTGSIGLVDQDTFLTEAYVSVHDSGKWYADLDVLQACSNPTTVLTGPCRCGSPQKVFSGDYVCIDTFDELLELPQSPAILRARDNWAARLAALCIYNQKYPGFVPFLVDPQDVCLQCTEKDFQEKMSLDSQVIVD